MFKVKQLHPKIVLLEFDHQYDMTMFFCRYQEFYESPNSNFRGKSFTLLDFMEWYSKRYGSWSYPEDWAGFNLNSSTIRKLIHEVGIKDWNKYDTLMLSLFSKLEEKCGEEFYLIGALKEDLEVIEHETAHALFSIYLEYRFETEEAISTALTPIEYKWLKNYLLDLKYDEALIEDEMQAYLSTDPSSDVVVDFKKKFGARRTNKLLKIFSSIFLSFKKDAAIV